MLATAADFHNTRLLSVFTVLAAILAVFRRTTVASWMSTLLITVFSHNYFPPFPGDRLSVVPMLELGTNRVKQGSLIGLVAYHEQVTARNEQ